ncbi:hypothetical protein [Streptomyces albus]|uniref:hypothetical protein n=1 Tax=Streptomyces albus TaxID=1888 RepID=UPI003D117745
MHVVEYEAKALEIDPEEMAARIRSAGGTFHGERLMRRYVYDPIPRSRAAGCGCATRAAR